MDAGTEWLRGVAKKNGTATLCVARGGVRYNAITLDAEIQNFHSATLPGSYPCSAEYHWVTQVLRALYVRAEVVHAGGPPRATTTTSFAASFTPLLPQLVTATIPVYLPSWLPAFTVPVYPTASLGNAQTLNFRWQAQLGSEPNCTAHYCEVWSIVGLSGLKVAKLEKSAKSQRVTDLVRGRVPIPVIIVTDGGSLEEPSRLHVRQPGAPRNSGQ